MWNQIIYPFVLLIVVCSFVIISVSVCCTLLEKIRTRRSAKEYAVERAKDWVTYRTIRSMELRHSDIKELLIMAFIALEIGNACHPCTSHLGVIVQTKVRGQRGYYLVCMNEESHRATAIFLGVQKPVQGDAQKEMMAISKLRSIAM